VRDQSTVSEDICDMDRNDVAGVNARRGEDEAVGGFVEAGRARECGNRANTPSAERGSMS
jgi:hypothetical protein